MKRFLFLKALPLVAALVMVSCSKDDSSQDGVPPIATDAQVLEGIVSNAQYQAGASEVLSVDEMADFLFGKEGANAEEEVLEARAAFLKRCREKEDELASELGQNGVPMGWHTLRYTYTTVDQNGDPIELSAFMSYGMYWLFGWEPLDQDDIRLVCPYTHTLEKECATRSEGGYEFTFSQTDDLFIMPDGQGFGQDRDHDQPYLNHGLQARQLYDAMVAGYRIYTQEKKGKMESDWHLQVFGASQGAADAMAVHRLLDTTVADNGKTLGEIWRFEYSYVCCGPYSPASTMESYFNAGEVYYPCVLPLAVKSMRMSYPEFAKKYPEERFYSQKYLERMDYWSNMVTFKLYKASELNGYLFDELQEGDQEQGSDVLKLKRILSAEVLDTSSDLYRDFMECLKKQDLTSGWKPRTKSYIYYSKGDEVVPYVNSERLISLFGSLADLSRSYVYTRHEFTCFKWMTKDW